MWLSAVKFRIRLFMPPYRILFISAVLLCCHLWWNKRFRSLTNTCRTWPSWIWDHADALFWLSSLLWYVDRSEATEEGAAEGAEDDQGRGPTDADRDDKCAFRRRGQADDEHLPEDHTHSASRLRLQTQSVGLCVSSRRHCSAQISSLRLVMHVLHNLSVRCNKSTVLSACPNISNSL